MILAMRRFRKGIIPLLVFFFLEGRGLAGFVNDLIPEQIAFLTVELSARSGESGTGVVVDAQGNGKGVIVLTAAHVLEDAEGISIHFSGGEIREGKLFYVNKEMDYVLLEAGEISLPVRITYPDRRRGIGSDLFVVGYSGLLRYAVSHGIVSSYAGDGFHTDAQASFGSSGSGVWDESGRLIGMVTRVYVEEVESGSQRFFMQRQTVAVDILRILEDARQHGFGF